MPAVPPSLKTRAVAIGALPPFVTMSSEPRPLVPIDVTTSGYEMDCPGDSVKAQRGIGGAGRLQLLMKNEIAGDGVRRRIQHLQRRAEERGRAGHGAGGGKDAHQQRIAC